MNTFFCQTIQNVWGFLAAGSEKTFFLPVQASTVARDSDWLFNFINWVSLFFFVLIVGLMFWFMFRYRRRSEADKVVQGATHNMTLEVAWSILPGFLLIFMFYEGFVGYMDQVIPPDDAYQIQLEARQWSWTFTYPNGHTDQNLYVPVNTRVVLTMKSDDVLHSFFIPEFRVKMDVVPGKYSKIWFEATRVTPKGEFYHLWCAEYCGTDHSKMKAEVHVLPPADFEQWLKVASDDSPFPPEERGKTVWKVQGCGQCHSLDGTKLIGPSWQGIWGKAETFVDGKTTTIDETYIRDSILYPQKQVVAGYPPTMPSFKGKLSERNVDDLILFIKSLK